MKRQWKLTDRGHIPTKIQKPRSRSFRKSTFLTYRKDEGKPSEEILKLAQFTVETSIDAIFWITPEGGFFHVNKAACQELGYTKDELKSLHIWDIDPLDTNEKWPATWAELKNKGSLKFESLHKTKTGKLIIVEISSNYLNYDNIEYACAFSRDITERKQAEEALTASERNFRAIFDGSFQFMGLLTVDGTLLDVNKAALDSMDLVKTDVLGKPFWETPWFTNTVKLLESIRASIIRASQGEFVRFEINFKEADGMLHYIDYSIKPFPDETGKIILLIPEGRDITDRKLAEDALKESEEKFRVLSETSAVAIFVYQGIRFVSVNQAIVGLTGYSKEELLNMNFLDIIHPEFRKLVFEHSQARQRDEPAPPIYEFKLLTRDGQVKWVEINAGRIMYNSKPAGVATLFDITDRKRVEEALSNAKAQAELYVDLMSHDIKNLNQSAMGYLEVALHTLEADKQIGIDQKYLLKNSLKAMDNSSTLISNVHMLQRLMTEGIKTMPIDLHDLFIKLDVQSLIPDNRQITINVEPVPHYRVEANELLKDVFSNLITNAIKHSSAEQPLTVYVKVEKTWDENLTCYRCIIEDNGPGIPDELKERLFHRFQRGPTKVQGKGLGLYLVRTLIEGYGGKVCVEDRVPGDHRKGARFVVILPAAKT